ncbi:MAG: knotted carbamoyltransferase YgeW [Planctomycetes bacterium]|nr:knotted carbamoyltransferase YgeW [Planctomycetota bacterium]
MDRPRYLLDQLDELKTNLYQQDFLLTWNHWTDELKAVLLVAEALEELHRANVSTRVFESGLAVSNFRDKSTRTRFSFASAANLLGLAVEELDETRSQIAHGETVRETANMISFLTEVIGIRDDIYLDEGHRYMASVAAAVEEGYEQNVLAQRPAVINLQCDLDHPTQTLADLLHLKKTFGSLDALRGKKLATTWAYSPSYGKPLSVPQGIICLMTRFGMHVTLAHPEGYELLPETVDRAGQYAAESGGSFESVESMGEAFCDADIVYPKSWASYYTMENRTAALRNGDTAVLEKIEEAGLETNARFKDWECSKQLMSMTRDRQALYMHCLPADISGVSCEAGEVAADVFERYRLTTYREASHKPFVIAAMILLTRFEKPAELLRTLSARGESRRLT